MSVRPTNEGDAVPVISAGLGSDPGSNTTDIEPPPDLLPGGAAEVPLAVSSALVQSKTAGGGGFTYITSITLDDAPTAGNLLVLVVFDQQSGSITPPSGFTELDFKEGTGNPYAHLVACKISDGTETTLTFPASPPADQVELAAYLEYSGVTDTLDTSASDYVTGDRTPTFPSITPTSGAPVLLIASRLGYIGYPDVGSPSLSGYTLDADSGWSNLGHATRVEVFSQFVSASGSYAPTLSDTGNNLGDKSNMIHLALGTTDTAWVNAPEFTDGDNTTYHEVATAADGVIARAALDGPYRLATSTLHIGYSGSASRTIDIEGANAADFTDAVTLDSQTFTSTGSYTADVVTFTLPDTTAYQFYRLLGDAGCRIYTWELYEANDAAAVVQITAHLADTADAHDASAISVADTGGNYAATDVEAALAEIAATYMTESDVVALITPDIYACDSLTVIASKGSIAAGAHTDLHAVGGTTVQIDETATTPGFNVEAAFSGVDGITDIYVHGYYTASHTATVQLYNYDTTGWDTVLTFSTSGTSMELLHASIADGAPYFDGSGNAVVRFYHASAGNPVHRLYLDYLAISHVAGTAGSLALDGLSDVDTTGKSDQDVLTWDLGSSTWIAAAAPGGTGSVATDTIWDAKGDLAVGSNADAAMRLAVGSNTYVLTADSTAALGVKWAAPSAGSAPTIPSFVQRITGAFSSGTTGLAVTMTAPTDGNRVLMWVCSGSRGATSITQTNVSWSNLYTTNGNSQYAELWVGVVSASAGTTATINFASSTRVQAFGVEVTTAYATAGTAATATGSSSKGVYAGPLTTSAGDIVVGITSNNGSAYGISIPNVPYAVVSAGGQGNGFILSSPGCPIYSQSMFDAASNVISALVVIS